MEPWEEEYLEEILSRKKGNSSDYTKEQRIYINECWEEITRKDGSKWYVPKQEVFKKQKQQQYRKRKRAIFLKKLGKFILGVLLAFDIFLRLSPYFPQDKVNQVLTSLNMTEVIIYKEPLSHTVPILTTKAVPVDELELTEFEFGDKIISYQASKSNFRTIYGFADIESFSIKEVQLMGSGNLEITCEIIGTVTDTRTLDIYLKCYDADGFLLDSVLVCATVSNGERFKVNGSTYIPGDTIQIALSGG